MKPRIFITITLATLMLLPAVAPSSAAAEPQVVMGVAGENGYVVVEPNGRIHYTITNDGYGYYYGWCRHHHLRHHCRYVPRPKHHKPPKHKKHKKHKKHHHHDNGRHRGDRHHHHHH